MALTEKQVRDWLEDATEDIERIDCLKGRVAKGQEHVHALLRPRHVRIQTLCEELLDSLDIVKGLAALEPGDSWGDCRICGEVTCGPHAPDCLWRRANEMTGDVE